MTDTTKLLNPVVALAREAAETILEFAKTRDKIEVNYKDDKSPVTEADLAAHKIIEQGLRALTPEIAVLSEEGELVDFTTRQTWQQYWCVDPLDGTKEFIHGYDDFSVNIALIKEDKPILGVIASPMTGECYYACPDVGAFKQIQQQEPQVITINTAHRTPCVAISRRHGLKVSLFLQNFPDYQTLTMGSSLKLCAVAEGTADLYPRIGPTFEWDTAAGQCILECAGGKIVDQSGTPLRYNTKESLINPHFIAMGHGNVAWAEWLPTP